MTEQRKGASGSNPLVCTALITQTDEGDGPFGM